MTIKNKNKTKQNIYKKKQYKSRKMREFGIRFSFANSTTESSKLRFLIDLKIYIYIYIYIYIERERERVAFILRY